MTQCRSSSHLLTLPFDLCYNNRNRQVLPAKQPALGADTKQGAFVMQDRTFVVWNEKYSTGIQLLDDQHKELFKLTNELFNNCRAGIQSAGSAFRKTVHSLVDYVKYHFTAEEKMFEKINYPMAADHKRQHESFVKQVLEAVKNFEEGEDIVPVNFANFLKDWIVTHIAVQDRQYAGFIRNLKRSRLPNRAKAD
jgi:hemerythrin